MAWTNEKILGPKSEEEKEVFEAEAEKFERELAEYQQKLNNRFGIGSGKLTPIDEPLSYEENK